MRWDVEIAVSQMVTDYLNSVVSSSILATCPAVTFYDPMSVEEDHRIVTQVPSATSMVEQPATFYTQTEVIIKSRWNQPTLATDHAAHFERVNAVRDVLFPADLVDRLNAAPIKPDGLSVNFVQPVRTFTTTVHDGWIVSETRMQIDVHLTTQSS